ncbi:MAG: hypothetical protein KAS72_07210 [Phycisphaerales bacterium]|nr:hypothetical protein [Phycisphaerales bacterium]
MSTTRNLCGVALIALAGTAVTADPEVVSSADRVSAERSIRLANDGTVSTGTYDLVFDNMTLDGSAAGLNVSYTDPASYTGGSTSTNAYLVPMSSTFGGYLAAWDAGDGIPNDIWWDEYSADLDVWGDPGSLWTVTKLETVVVVANQDGVERDSTIQFLFFNIDGDQYMGGASYTYTVPVGYEGWFDDEYDFYADCIAFDIYDIGYTCFDWVNTPDIGTDTGLGMIIAGGDLLDPAFPYPDTLWTLGQTLVDSWWCADAVTNVDPMFDGETGTSYLDILNTGDLYNHGYVDDVTNPTSELCHDFPFRIYADIGPGPCPGDLDGDDDTDGCDLGILLAYYNINDGGDLDDDGDTDQNDLGILLADFGCVPPPL